jgi:hypothetical protein
VIPLILGITCLEAAMMGRLNRDQGSLFYAFRLDDRVPKDHLLRRIDVQSPFSTTGEPAEPHRCEELRSVEAGRAYGRNGEAATALASPVSNASNVNIAQNGAEARRVTMRLFPV